MISFFIDFAYCLAFPFILPIIAYKAIFKGKYRKSFPGMFGFSPDLFPPIDKSIWVHAVSLGEIVSCAPILRALRENYPDIKIVLTATTETGYAAAMNHYNNKLADKVQFFPFDFSRNLRRFIKDNSPSFYIGLETELWPNLFRELKRANCPIFILNGRISKKSFPKYLRFRWVFQKVLKPVTAFGMQTQADADRMSTICRHGNIVVTGNVKYDRDSPNYSDEQLQEVRSMLSIMPGEKVIVFGSTHSGEEEIAIDLLKRLSLRDCVIVIVPRHPERFDEVWQTICDTAERNRYRVSTSENRQVTQDGGCRVVLADVMGQLDKIYAISDISVVCGSLVPGIGGHNLWEPAAHGVPVLYGPHLWGQKEMLDLMDGNGGLQVTDNTLLGECFKLLSDEKLCQETGALAKRTVEQNRGAVSRNMQLINQYFKSSRK